MDSFWLIITIMKNPKAILKAVELLNGPTGRGGQAELARRISKSTAFVNEMARGKKPVPTELCLLIENAVDGKVTCSELRPDVFRHFVSIQKSA